MQSHDEQLRALKKQQETFVATGYSGGGMVTVDVSGHGDIKCLHIDQSIFDQGDVEMLEVLLQGAISEAFAKVRDFSQEQIRAALNIAKESGHLVSFSENDPPIKVT